MSLCWIYANYPTELRADFQRFYGLNLDDMGKTYSIDHAAICAAHLPRESAVSRAVDPANEWSNTEYLLHAIEFRLRVISWQQSKDGAKKTNKPKPLPTPTDTARVKNKINNTDYGMIAERLGINKEVDNG